jgi:hypothetical protein
MKRGLALVAGFTVAFGGGTAAPAQTVILGVHGALGDYREASSNLRYTGGGFGGALWLRVGRLHAEGAVTRTSYTPRKESTALTDFTATEIDARVGVEIASGFAGEVGLLRRNIDPALAAQEMGAARVGVRYSKLIGPGATVGLRGAYLAGAKFTGKGSAGLAFELGLLVSVGPQNGRYRFTADYGFQRIDRRVDLQSGRAKVPIQQSLVRLGVAVGF